jgi:Zn ribbon nucleic-acid-binding protein
MKKLVSNCPLCEEHSLHVIGEGDVQMQQCINCGYVSSPKFIGTKEDNEEYKKLPSDMKKWSKECNDRIWIPTILTLPIGMLYPIDIDNMVNHKVEMKWGFAPMVDISERDKENYPDGNGGYYTKKIDTENPNIYDEFFEAMVFINNVMKDDD